MVWRSGKPQLHPLPFLGGGAAPDRRERRQRFLARVLLQMQFQGRSRGDMITAQLDKFDRATTLAALEQLGRLALCARQLDMLMDTDPMLKISPRPLLQRIRHASDKWPLTRISHHGVAYERRSQPGNENSAERSNGFSCEPVLCGSGFSVNHRGHRKPQDTNLRTLR